MTAAAASCSLFQLLLLWSLSHDLSVVCLVLFLPFIPLYLLLFAFHGLVVFLELLLLPASFSTAKKYPCLGFRASVFGTYPPPPPFVALLRTTMRVFMTGELFCFEISGSHPFRVGTKQSRQEHLVGDRVLFLENGPSCVARYSLPFIILHFSVNYMAACQFSHLASSVHPDVVSFNSP